MPTDAPASSIEEVGDRLGQGNTFLGEADVLCLLGDNEKALDAYRSARKLYEEVGDRLGQGNTFYGEAVVLFELGDNEKALDAYRSARKLFEQIGHQLGQGNTFLGEADVLFRLGETRRLSPPTEAHASSSRRSGVLEILEILSWERRGYRAAKGTSTMQRISPLKPSPPIARRGPWEVNGPLGSSRRRWSSLQGTWILRSRLPEAPLQLEVRSRREDCKREQDQVVSS